MLNCICFKIFGFKTGYILLLVCYFQIFSPSYLLSLPCPQNPDSLGSQAGFLFQVGASLSWLSQQMAQSWQWNPPFPKSELLSHFQNTCRRCLTMSLTSAWKISPSLPAWSTNKKTNKTSQQIKKSPPTTAWALSRSKRKVWRGDLFRVTFIHKSRVETIQQDTWEHGLGV